MRKEGGLTAEGERDRAHALGQTLVRPLGALTHPPQEEAGRDGRTNIVTTHTCLLASHAADVAKAE